jgi:hypothetical protein
MQDLAAMPANLTTAFHWHSPIAHVVLDFSHAVSVPVGDM